MVGTRAAYVFDETMKLKAKIPLNQFTEKNKKLNEGKIVVLDGKINNDIVHIAEIHHISFLIGNKADSNVKPKLLRIYTKQDLSS